MSLRIMWASSAHASVATCIRGKEMSKQCASTAKKRRWPRTLSSMRSSRGLSVVKVRFKLFSFRLSFSHVIGGVWNSQTKSLLMDFGTSPYWFTTCLFYIEQFFFFFLLTWQCCALFNTAVTVQFNALLRGKMLKKKTFKGYYSSDG